MKGQTVWAVLALVLFVDSGESVPNREAGHFSMAKKTRYEGSRSMAYFIERGIEIRKPQYNILQRVKRAVMGSEDEKPVIQELSIISNISSRFSNTDIKSVMHNPWTDDKEATFSVMLPENAFMSNFTMEIDNELYIAEVKSKKEAEDDYKKAQAENRTAGMVSNEDFEPDEQVRGMEKFKVSVNVAANSTIFFKLTYMELLERRGLYQQRISVRPNQVVADLEVVILIYEPQGIRDLTVREPNSNSVELQDTLVLEPSNMVSEIRYHPTADKQKSIGKSKDQVGLKGDLVVSYDVIHKNDAGLVQVEGDYFVHYFSPDQGDLKPLPKNIVFVIDISGSMSGSKIVKTRESMLVILEQLRPVDRFLIQLFDDDNEYWPEANSQPVEASRSNIDSAKSYVREKVKAVGGTNINDAVVEAARIVQSSGRYGANMVIFLTDGDPTVGVTGTEDILQNVDSAANGKVSIFSLGFGFNMNFDLLRAISFRNGGFARRIYDEVDADVQLQEFYEEISTPLLYDVKVDYGNLQIALTQTNFAQYFKGSEIIITGKFDVVPEILSVKVDAMAEQPYAREKQVICSLPIEVPEVARKIFRPGSLERLYVYHKIRDQLRKILMTDNQEEKDRLEAFALEMAIEYHLVTPLTSFIIVQNDRTAPGSMEDHKAFYDTGNILLASAGSGNALRSDMVSLSAAFFICSVLVWSLQGIPV